MTPLTLPPAQLITTMGALLPAVDALRRAGIFALDTESNSLYAYHHRVCLIQLSTPSTDYLIDALALRDLEPLRQLVAEPDIEVVMHAAENDILLLHRDFDFRFARVFDTLWAARVLGWKQAGLAAILLEQFEVEQDKRMQRTDWGQRPLTAAQLEYARLDTHYLLPLRQRQMDELKQRRRWQEALEAFAGLTNIIWEDKDPPTFWRVPGAYDLEPPRQAILQAVFEWREKAAERQDVPPFKVMNNDVLLALAQQAPATESELHQIKGMGRNLRGPAARSLLQAVRKGQQNPPPRPPERPFRFPRPDDAMLASFDRLRAWRTQAAQERGVDPDVVLTNQMLMAIARALPTSLDALATTGLLGPWKLETYGPDIVRIIRSIRSIQD